MIEHLAQIATIHPPAARCASIKMLGFFFERIGHTTANALPARELNDRAALFNHFGSGY
jgi:hypothetical protein